MGLDLRAPEACCAARSPFYNYRTVQKMYVGEAPTALVASICSREMPDARSELIASIRLWGIAEPVQVVMTPSLVEIADGHNRIRSAQELGLPTVPVVVWAGEDEWREPIIEEEGNMLYIVGPTIGDQVIRSVLVDRQSQKPIRADKKRRRRH